MRPPSDVTDNKVKLIVFDHENAKKTELDKHDPEIVTHICI